MPYKDVMLCMVYMYVYSIFRDLMLKLITASAILHLRVEVSI